MLLPLAVCPSAKAGSIVGTIGFNVQGNISSSSADLTSAITFDNTRTNNSATGDWSNFSSDSIAGGLLASSSTGVNAFDSDGQGFGFSEAGFGTFTGTILSDDIQSYSGSLFSSSTRVIRTVGFFNPGSTLVAYGFTKKVIARVNMVFVGFTGVGFGRSASMSMQTQAVPEPSTIFGLLVGGAALIGVSRKRGRTPS